MTRIEIPTLRTVRLVLRAFSAADLDALAAMQADPDVMRFLGTGAAAGRPRSRGETWANMQSFLGQWALRGYGIFAMEEAATGRFVGRAGILHPWEWPEPELAYALSPAFWGQGLAAEAAAAARDWAFAEAGVTTLASFIKPGNDASARVAARLGAVREGMAELAGMAVERWVHPPPGRGAIA